MHGRMDLLNAMAESGERPQERQSKMSEEMRRLASTPAQWVEDTKCRGHFCTRSKVANWHRWICRVTRLSSVDECHGCGLHDVPSEPWTRVHRLRRSLLAGVRGSSLNQGIVNGELVYVCERSRTELVTHRWHGPAIVVGKEKNNVFVSYRGGVTKVATECLRKASASEPMSWDITTKEKTLFEMAPDKENLFVGNNPCSMKLVNFLTLRCQTRWRDRRGWKKTSIHQ